MGKTRTLWWQHCPLVVNYLLFPLVVVPGRYPHRIPPKIEFKSTKSRTAKKKFVVFVRDVREREREREREVKVKVKVKCISATNINTISE